MIISTKQYMENELMSNCFDAYVDLSTDKINSEESGIILENNCSTEVLFILLQCTQNLEIFNSIQKNNIGNYINKILYAQ